MPRQKGRGKLLGESVVRGLRMEPDLAHALRRYAESQAEAHGVAVNMAAAARDLLRRALGVCSAEHSCRRESYFAALAESRHQLASALAGATR